jgi:hypothetical protein
MGNSDNEASKSCHDKMSEKGLNMLGLEEEIFFENIECLDNNIFQNLHIYLKLI